MASLPGLTPGTPHQAANAATGVPSLPQSPHPLVSACGTPTTTTPNLHHQQQQYHQQHQLSMAAAVAALTAPSLVAAAAAAPPVTGPCHLSAGVNGIVPPPQTSPQTSSPLVDNCSNNCATLVIGNLDSNCTEEQLNCILHRCVNT